MASEGLTPCVRCGSTDIAIHDCGYSSFNVGDVTCRDCKYRVQVSGAGSSADYIRRWNAERSRLQEERTILSERMEELDAILEPAPDPEPVEGEAEPRWRLSTSFLLDAEDGQELNPTDVRYLHAIGKELHRLRARVQPADPPIFSCPACGDPSATVGQHLDIHPGATYRCSECGAEILFDAMTAEEYVSTARVQPRRVSEGTAEYGSGVVSPEDPPGDEDSPAESAGGGPANQPRRVSREALEDAIEKASRGLAAAVDPSPATWDENNEAFRGEARVTVLTALRSLGIEITPMEED